MALLGSSIDPRLFQQDYSGYVRAGEMQAQGIANLGERIGSAIKDFGEAKKEQKKVDAYNKASAKSIEAAITLADSYGVGGARETLSPFLEAYNDPNLSPIEKAALLDEAKAMIPNVFGRFDARQADEIQRAQFMARNAPPMPEPITYERETNVPYGGGFLDDILKGSDGQFYDESLNPILDIDAYARGEAPEVYSGYSTFSDDLGSMDTPLPLMSGESAAANIDYASSLGVPPQTASFPTDINIASSAPSLDAGKINARRIDAALDGRVLPPREEIAQLERDLGIDENQRREIKSRLRFDGEKEERQEPVNITMDKLSELVAIGVRPKGTLNPDGTFSVTDFNTGSLPQGMTIKGDGKGGIEIFQGPLGAKTEKAERAAKFQETRQTNFIIDKANEAEEIIDNSISTYGGGTLMDMAKAKIPGTQEYKLKNQIFPALKDSIALDSLRQLKAASPTGSSGLGALTEKEAKRLENMYGVLEVGGDKVTLKNDIKRLKQTAFDYIHGSKDERKKALAEGKITKDQNDQVEQMYAEQILRVPVVKSKPAAPLITPTEQQLIDKYKTK